MNRKRRENLIMEFSLSVATMAAIMGSSVYVGDPRSRKIGFEIEFTRFYLPGDDENLNLPEGSTSPGKEASGSSISSRVARLLRGFHSFPRNRPNYRRRCAPSVS